MLTVCIVEDTRSIRERVAARLAAMGGVAVLGAFGSAEEALSRIPELSPRLLVLDIGLPRMSGTEALARLLERGFAGDAIMFTVFDHDEHLFRALELGATGYILKEERAAGVQRAVEEYLAGGAPMSATIAKRVLQSFRAGGGGGASARLEVLSERQLHILRHVADGLLNKEIADVLGVSEGTIKQHIHKIYRKLSVNNRAEAVKLYLS